jgi:hypothetical protein
MNNYAQQFAIAFENKLNALEKSAKNGTIYLKDFALLATKNATFNDDVEKPNDNT